MRYMLLNTLCKNNITFTYYSLLMLFWRYLRFVLIKYFKRCTGEIIVEGSTFSTLTSPWKQEAKHTTQGQTEPWSTVHRHRVELWAVGFPEVNAGKGKGRKKSLFGVGKKWQQVSTWSVIVYNMNCMPTWKAQNKVESKGDD